MVDKLCWRPEKKGFFSVKTAYWIARTNVLTNSLASTSHGNTYHALWKRLWKANVPGKVRICIWRACSDLLPTRAKLFTKGYRGDLCCLLCSHAVEDIAHVLCKCPTVVEILTATPFHLERSLLPNIDFKEWMLDHALHLKQEVFDKLLMVLWALWQNKNKMLWEEKRKPAKDLLLASLAWLEEFGKATKLEHMSAPKQRQRWKPTQAGKLKLNVDGSFLPQITHGGTKGILRDDTGNFRAAFAVPVQSVASAKHVELCAIDEGIQLLKQLQISSAVIETDCLEAIQDIAETHFTHVATEGLLDNIRGELLSRPNIILQHAPRSCNRVAHCLANSAYEARASSIWLDHPPVLIMDLIKFDCNHMG